MSRSKQLTLLIEPEQYDELKLQAEAVGKVLSLYLYEDVVRHVVTNVVAPCPNNMSTNVVPNMSGHVVTNVVDISAGDKSITKPYEYKERNGTYRTAGGPTKYDDEGRPIINLGSVD